MESASATAWETSSLIRLPKALRVYIFIFGTVWSGLLLGPIVGGLSSGSPGALLVLPVPLLGCWFFYRSFRISVEMGPIELVVRNRYRTRHLPREDIEDFRDAVVPGPSITGIHVLVRSGRLVALDVTRQPAFFSRGRERQERQLDRLRAWLENGQPR